MIRMDVEFSKTVKSDLQGACELLTRLRPDHQRGSSANEGDVIAVEWHVIPGHTIL